MQEWLRVEVFKMFANKHAMDAVNAWNVKREIVLMIAKLVVQSVRILLAMHYVNASNVDSQSVQEIVNA